MTGIVSDEPSSCQTKMGLTKRLRSFHQNVSLILVVIIASIIINSLLLVSAQNIRVQKQKKNSNILACEMEVIVDESLTNHFKYIYSDR